MVEINWSLSERIRKAFPKKKVYEHIYHITWYNRYIQISTPIDNDNIHYECVKERVELHFEGDLAPYEGLIEYLREKTKEKEDLDWNIGNKFVNKQILKPDNVDDILRNFIALFDGLINEYNEKEGERYVELGEEDCICPVSPEKGESTVSLYTCNLEQVLKLPLQIPDYQRIYCWEEQNVIRLFEDVINFINDNPNDNPGGEYRLGTIILHHHEKKYDIIDGQQRLITLALWLYEMGTKAKLLEEKLWSKQSQQYVAYNKHLMRELHRKRGEMQNSEKLAKQILKYIQFSVLVLENSSLDLAYTFFSNQNSRGVALTDYDLLKAHHLRYIPLAFERQATYAAETWNKMIEDGRSEREQYEVSAYEMALDTYIYRLRRWMRKRDCQDEKVRYRIKQEYEATPIIDSIPPFGERFYFNEPIQGGTHFFEYVKQHLAKFRRFTRTEEYLAIHPLMTGRSRSCSHYRDVIEATLFAYYLKFEENYLADALAVIMRIILQHRYDNKSAKKESVIKYARDTELVLMIDQATSPTFLLAEAWNIAKNMFINRDQSIKTFMSDRAAEIMKRIEKSIAIQSFKELNK